MPMCVIHFLKVVQIDQYECSFRSIGAERSKVTVEIIFGWQLRESRVFLPLRSCRNLLGGGRPTCSDQLVGGPHRVINRPSREQSLSRQNGSSNQQILCRNPEVVGVPRVSNPHVLVLSVEIKPEGISLPSEKTLGSFHFGLRFAFVVSLIRGLKMQILISVLPSLAVKEDNFPVVYRPSDAIGNISNHVERGRAKDASGDLDTTPRALAVCSVRYCYRNPAPTGLLRLSHLDRPRHFDGDRVTRLAEKQFG